MSDSIRPLSFLVLAALAGCGGRMLEPRYVAVHNTMTAMGMSMSGSISEGSLAEGAEAVIPATLTPGTCYTILALGSGSVGDIDVVVRDGSGAEVAHDSTTDGEAAAQFCPSYGGVFNLAVRMRRGSGSYLVSSWTGGTAAATPYYDPYSGAYDPYAAAAAVTPAAHGGPGTCEEPYELPALTAMRGNTSTGDAQMVGSCISGGTAAEHVYWFELTDRSVVTATMNSAYDGALYLLSQCGDSRSEFACNDDAPTTSRSEIRANLEAGLYYLVVDGYGGATGDYEVSLDVQPMRTEESVCGAATTLPLGTPVAGTTASSADYFAGSCGESAGPDQVYTLDVPSASRVRLRMQSTHDGTLHVRSSCLDSSSEIACNTDFGVGHNLINMTAAAGRYYVFADGSSDGDLGDFSLLADIAPAGGTPGGPGDSCATATRWDPATGSSLVADNFTATDDLAGSCGGSGSPDTVYRLDLRSRTRVRASFADAEFPPVAYLRRGTCTDTTAEVVCMNPMVAGGTTVVDQTLAAGTYFLVVDGTGGPDAFGAATMNLQLDDMAALDAACRGAPLLRPGTQVTGTTVGDTDRFQATCASGAASPDRVYRLTIRRRSTVRISSWQDEWDGAIYIRGDCTDATTELGCNDDAGDNRHSMIETELEPGTYYVFMDGFGSGSSGEFTLDVDVTASP